MKYGIVVKPNELSQETSILIKSKDYLPFSGAYIGAGTYCCGLEIDNGIEFQKLEEGFIYNLQIGKYNSIAEGLFAMIGRTHNTKSVDSGALSLLFKQKNCTPSKRLDSFNQKGSIVIQNDVYIGNSVRIMPNVVIRNGAVIAANSHVVSDVPPYAIVGGNPAKVIGYRFCKEIIEKFCDRFFDEENERFIACCSGNVPYSEDTYFAFVDFYENYSNYTYILESFLNAFVHDERKRLILFVQTDLEKVIKEDVWNGLRGVVDEIERQSNIHCQVLLKRGNTEEAEKIFIKCQHYLISRTFRAVHFSCLADLMKMEIHSGVDRKLLFSKSKNMIPQQMH